MNSLYLIYIESNSARDIPPYVEHVYAEDTQDVVQYLTRLVLDNPETFEQYDMRQVIVSSGWSMEYIPIVDEQGKIGSQGFRVLTHEPTSHIHIFNVQMSIDQSQEAYDEHIREFEDDIYWSR